MFRIDASGEKGVMSRLLPMAKEFFELIESNAARQQSGFVFNLLSVEEARKDGICRAVDWVSKIGTRIGKEAGIVDYEDPNATKIKNASFHDLRRSFGHRWANKIHPTELMHLMRKIWEFPKSPTS